ncbi:MAG: site-specific integrase [Proteobacteria bacterium]|nr:site-specific integrase [Pseudomonadota bacterium]
MIAQPHLRNMTNQGQSGFKCLAPRQADRLLKTCRKRAEADLWSGRKTWITRCLLVHLALASGLRVSEMAALKNKDLFLADTHPNIRVRHERKSRSVYLGRNITDHIHKYQDWKRRSWRRDIDGDDFVFESPHGGPFSTGALAYSFKRALETMGLDGKYTIHSARHSYATYLLARTSDLQFVMNQMGHSNTSVTSLYVGLLPPEDSNGIEEFLD